LEGVTILLEICTSDIRISEVKKKNGYQNKIDQIPIKNLTDFGGILKNISSVYPNISRQCSQSEKLEKSLKTAMFRPNQTVGYRGYQPDIKANIGYHSYSVVCT